MDGRSVRFCDQCSKFEDISLFEGSRRTCNDKLERTRQARSDKRRRLSEHARRAALRLQARRVAPYSGASIAGKRSHSGLYGLYGEDDCDDDEDWELEASGVLPLRGPPSKRTRELSPFALPLAHLPLGPLPPLPVNCLAADADGLQAEGEEGRQDALKTLVGAFRSAVSSSGGRGLADVAALLLAELDAAANQQGVQLRPVEASAGAAHEAPLAAGGGPLPITSAHGSPL
ncbi:hypothetical protein GPECTOR_29g30 [Gonium pectorale]|uniref:SBP-type domain-containing protein n=1 Tax=Gonium pectorale TaxID=33097 RepID=A0A150GEG3_GONPE|nr:hypothetical protein GPECTOR_29g30 [Gonium pectorale]|eukprot:KXZ48251.1 hypothetical protein GPECTOR_29g30 [Gonium pectorale]